MKQKNHRTRRNFPASPLTAILAALLLFIAARALAADMALDVLDAEIKVRSDFSIVVDGELIRPDVPPVERGGIIFIPLRFAAEALRADVTWFKADKTAVLKFTGGRIVRMTIGNPDIDLGDGVKMLPVAPFIFENRTMIPLKPTAECGWFRVDERTNEAILIYEGKKIESFSEPKIKTEDASGKKATSNLDFIREKAAHDPITKSLAPYVNGAWALTGVWFLIVLVIGLVRGRPDGWKDMIFIGLLLSGGVFFITRGGVMLSTYWAAIVAIGTCVIGLISTESYEEKLVTMASTAQGFGLICTLFGLGLLIGPAIASRDIAAIGYGIYVKIEPTITGLTISILLSMLSGAQAKNQSQREDT